MGLRVIGLVLLAATGLVACDPAGDLSGDTGPKAERPVLIETRRPLPQAEDLPPEMRRRREDRARPRRVPITVPSPSTAMPQRTPPSTSPPVPRRPFEGTVPFPDGTGAPRDPIVRGNVIR